MANGLFSQLFAYTQVENIITTSSDHFAVMLSLSKHVQERREAGMHYNFKYEAAWCRVENYQETVENLWTEGSVGQRSLQATWNNLNNLASFLSA